MKSIKILLLNSFLIAPFAAYGKNPQVEFNFSNIPNGLEVTQLSSSHGNLYCEGNLTKSIDIESPIICDMTHTDNSTTLNLKISFVGNPSPLFNEHIHCDYDDWSDLSDCYYNTYIESSTQNVNGTEKTADGQYIWLLNSFSDRNVFVSAKSAYAGNNTNSLVKNKNLIVENYSNTPLSITSIKDNNADFECQSINGGPTNKTGNSCNVNPNSIVEVQFLEFDPTKIMNEDLVVYPSSDFESGIGAYVSYQCPAKSDACTLNITNDTNGNIWHNNTYFMQDPTQHSNQIVVVGP